MFAEDLSPFFNAAELATAATLDGEPVTGIFDNAYIDPFGVASTEPRYTLPSADAATATNASMLVIGATTYRVRSVQPDGTGITVLTLERQ